MEAKEMEEIRIRVNAVENELLRALDRVAKTYPELTTAEVGRATLRILKSLNDDEIRDSIKTPK